MRALSRHPVRLRAIAIFMAAVYLFASLGVMPSPVIIAHWLGAAAFAGESSERYPCEDHACGCVSAAECWSNCCCHTPRQRLVWAITHGIQPPASVRFTEEEWIAASNAVTADSAECSMCVAKVQDKLSRGIATVPVGVESESCNSCALTDAASCGESANCSKSDNRVGARVTIGFSLSALACKGIQQILAVSVPPALPVRVADVLVPPLSFPVRAASYGGGPASRSLDVPEPPPRSA